jgi:hypothetical protein
VDDERLAQACRQRVHALPAVQQIPPPPVTMPADVPVVLRAAADAAPNLTPKELIAGPRCSS